jgi:hypothetical protein
MHTSGAWRRFSPSDCQNVNKICLPEFSTVMGARNQSGTLLNSFNLVTEFKDVASTPILVEATKGPIT